MPTTNRSTIIHILLFLIFSESIQALSKTITIRVLVHESYILNITVPNYAKIQDIVTFTNNKVSDQVVSSRTTVCELRLNGASLFDDDIAADVIGTNIVTAVWGFRYIVNPPSSSNCVGLPFEINLYHDSTNALLVTALQTTHPWHNCKDIIDIRVQLVEDSHENNPSLYPTFMDRGTELIIDSLPGDESWSLYAIEGRKGVIESN